MSNHVPDWDEWDRDPSSREKAMQSIENLAGLVEAVMRIVHARVDDAAAVEQLRPIVESEPSLAASVLEDVSTIRDRDRGYLPDRACRLLAAALNGTPVSPIDPQDTVLYKREQELGWRPLQEAFAQLCQAVPELTEIGKRATLLPDAGSIETNHGSYGTFSGSFFATPSAPMQALAGALGPGSGHPDPLIRSKLALTIATRYIDAVTRQPDALDLRRALWEWIPADGTDPLPFPHAFRL